MTNELTSLEMNRLEKLERLRQKGLNPIQPAPIRTHTSQAASREFEAAEAAAPQGEPVPPVKAARGRSPTLDTPDG